MLQSSGPRPTISSFLSADTLPIISNLLFSSDSTSPSSVSPATNTENQKSVTFAEPEEVTESNDKSLQAINQGGVAITQEKTQSMLRNMDDTKGKSLDERNMRIKAVRSKTIYSLMYPHPTPWQKLHIRPRKYLQLQQWTDISSRPLPAYEVVPARCFSTVSRRANAKFQRMSKWRNCFGPDEMFVTRAGDYTPAPNTVAAADSASTSSDESTSSMVQDPGATIAAICAVSARRRSDGIAAELALDDETVWEATPIANRGGYEFVWTDDHGLRTVVRWVARSSKSRPRQQRSGSWAGTTSASGKEIDTMKDRAIAERRFTFSTIDPLSRRHPVIASLTNSCMEVYDDYTLPAPKLSTTSKPSSGDSAKENDSNADEQKPADGLDGEATLSMSSPRLCHTDEQTRKLILVSGIWVALQEGWSPNFRYAKAGLPAASLLARSLSSTSYAPTPPNSVPSSLPAPALGTVNVSNPTRRSRFSSCPTTPSSLSQVTEPATKTDAITPTDEPVVALPVSTPAIRTKAATTTPASFSSSENYSPIKPSCKSTMRRASIQLLPSSLQSTLPPACEVTHKLMCASPDTALEHCESQHLQQAIHSQPQWPPQIQTHHQCAEPNTVVGVSNSSGGTGAGAGMIYVPSSAAMPINTAPIAPAAQPPHQTRKLNRIVRGLLVGAVNKMDKRANLAGVNMRATGGFGHHLGFDDVSDGSMGYGGTYANKAEERSTKAARRRTIM